MEEKWIFDDIKTLIEQRLNLDNPYESFSIVFVPNLFSSDSYIKSMVFGNLIFIDENLIFSQIIVENWDETYFHFCNAFA